MVVLVITWSHWSAWGQDIEKVLEADSLARSYWDKLLATDPLVVTGGLSTRMAYAIAPTGQTTQKPFSYMANGNIDLDIFGYKMPLSFTYSSQNLSYQMASPIKMNRLKFNPQYKWVKLYLGQSSLSFSPYTLSGMQFSGVGLELTPKGSVKGSFMRGKLFDAVQYNPDKPLVQPVYERMATAFKVGYQKGGTTVETSMLFANEDTNSLNLPTDTLLRVAPLQNVAYSLTGKFSPSKAVGLDIEYATSAINLDRMNRQRPLDQMLWGDYAAVLRFAAYKLGINFSPSIFKFGFSFEHIDPDFKTLGAYYSRNDFQNVTFNSSISLFKGKLAFMGNIGVEKDNLQSQKKTQSTRNVGSLNGNLQLSKKTMLSLSYSNFQSFSNIKNQFDYISPDDPNQYRDTLRFSQINQSGTASLNYNMKQSREEVQRLSLYLTLNETASSQSGTADARTYLYNANAQWSLSMPITGFNCSASLVSSYNISALNSVVTAGPMLSVRRPFLKKKLTTGVNWVYNQTYVNDQRTNANMNIRSNARFDINKMQNISLDLYYINRNTKDKPNQQSFNLSVTYNLKLDKMKWFRPIKPNTNESKSDIDEETESND